jgi:glycosyltransferase involved in cell wall biosynthesis
MGSNVSDPKISAIMPVKNAGSYLADAIASVLTQSLMDFELLIIDDGSTDGSAEVAAAFADPRIRILTNPGRGLVDALNEGVRQAKGQYVARMDADDLCLPNRLECQVAMLESDPSLALVAAFIERIAADGTPLPPWDADREARDPNSIQRMLPMGNCLAHPTVMARRGLLVSNPYDRHAWPAEDYELWMRLVAQGHRLGKVTEALLTYRVHPCSVTALAPSQGFFSEKENKARICLLQKRWYRLLVPGSFEGRVLIALVRRGWWRLKETQGSWRKE